MSFVNPQIGDRTRQTEGTQLAAESMKSKLSQPYYSVWQYLHWFSIYASATNKAYKLKSLFSYKKLNDNV